MGNKWSLIMPLSMQPPAPPSLTLSPPTTVTTDSAITTHSHQSSPPPPQLLLSQSQPPISVSPPQSPLSPLSPPPPQMKHFCVRCNKQFSSHQAYGGHVRIHSSKFNSKGKTKKMNKEKVEEKEADIENKNQCCLCGEHFQTLLFLVEHVSRPPIRDWIRPLPPPEEINFTSPEDDDDEYEDAWNRHILFSTVTRDVHEAACTLMWITYDFRNYSNMETSSSEDEDHPNY